MPYKTVPQPARTHLPLLPLSGAAPRAAGPDIAAAPTSALTAAEFAVTSIDLYLTSTCNRQCAYCFLDESFFASRQSMSVRTVGEILTWTSGSTIEEITLLGGEPALHPEFASIVALIRAAGLRARIVTNGSNRFRQAMRKPDVAAGIAWVAVSLDAPTAAIFDKLRGPRAFRDAMLTIEQMKEQEKLFDINVTVVKSCLPYVGQMLSLAEDSGARRINIHWFSEVGRGRAADEAVTAAQWRAVLDEVSAFKPRGTEFVVDCELGFGYGLPGEDRDMCAVRERSNLQFLPDGSVFSCGMLVDRPDLAGYQWQDGGLYVRPGESEVTRTSIHCAGCPMRGADAPDRESSPIALCIYNRLERSELSPSAR